MNVALKRNGTCSPQFMYASTQQQYCDITSLIEVMVGRLKYAPLPHLARVGRHSKNDDQQFDAHRKLRARPHYTCSLIMHASPRQQYYKRPHRSLPISSSVRTRSKICSFVALFCAVFFHPVFRSFFPGGPGGGRFLFFGGLSSRNGLPRKKSQRRNVCVHWISVRLHVCIIQCVRWLFVNTTCHFSTVVKHHTTGFKILSKGASHWSV